MRRPFVSLRSIARQRAQSGGGAGPALVPFDVAALYGIDRLHSLGFHGEGEHIGFVEFTPPNAEDDRQFWSQHSLQPQLNTPARSVSIGGGSADPPALTETDLDLQYAGALAPAASLTAYVVSAAGSLESFLGSMYDALHQAAEDGAQVVSISLGTSESLLASLGRVRSRRAGRSWQGFARYSQAFDQLVRSRELRVFAAAGDSGAYAGSPLQWSPPQPIWPAIQPSVLAVGGTQLATPGDVGSGEQAWGGQTLLPWLPAYNPANTLTTASGGGGVSRLIPPPDYQLGLGFKGRATPDIAAFAGPLTIVDQGRSLSVWGTSASAPIAAASTALVHQACGRWPAHADFYAAARDVTAGNNWNNLLALLLHLRFYRAASGYDLCTGAGVPDVQALSR